MILAAIGALLQILHGPRDHRDHPIAVKSVVTGDISSVAHVSKERFMHELTPELANPHRRGRGGRAPWDQDAIGTFAKAVVTELFRPYFLLPRDEASVPRLRGRQRAPTRV